MWFFGFLQVGEVVAPLVPSYDPAIHLCFGDVKVDNYEHPQFLEVCIKASKTDPFCLGVSVYLGVTSSSLCPVAVILHYMVQRGIKPGPFFILSDGKYLTRDIFGCSSMSGCQHLSQHLSFPGITPACRSDWSLMSITRW